MHTHAGRLDGWVWLIYLQAKYTTVSVSSFIFPYKPNDKMSLATAGMHDQTKHAA